MTPEEAIRQLCDLNFKLYKLSYGDIELFNENPEYGYDFDSALSLATEVIEKQIPEKPLPAEAPMSAINIRCPMCRKTFSVIEVVAKLKYCPDCGQRLLWEDEK